MSGRKDKEDAIYVDKSNQSFSDGLMQEFEKRALFESQDHSYIEHNIMQMFYKSPFYEKNSDNFDVIQQLGVIKGNFKEEFENRTGIQFVLSKYFPERKLGWIEKRKRHAPGDGAKSFDVVSVYYVLAIDMNFVIFQAPTLPHIVNTRINNAIFYSKKAFEII